MKWVKWFFANLGWVGLVFMIVALCVALGHAQHENSAAQKAANARLVALAKERDAAVATHVSDKKLVAGLNDELRHFVEDVKRADPKAHIDAAVTTEVRIVDQVPLEPTGPTVDGCPAEWKDAYGRFHVILTPPQRLERNQFFTIESVYARSGDGRIRLLRDVFAERDPRSGAPIPSDGLRLTSTFQVVDEAPAAPPVFHPRLIGGLDHRAALGVGVELLNGERSLWPVVNRLTGGVAGYWDKKSGDGRLGVRLGYRVIGNVTVGAYYAPLTTSGVPAIGADVAVQITR